MAKARFQQVYVVSNDVTRTGDFYRNALGLETRFVDGDRWVQLSDGIAKFAIASPEEAAKGATAPVAVFEVDSLDEALRDVTAHGGTVLETRDMGSHGKTAGFLDPDGNRLQFFARQPSAGAQ